MLAINNFFHSFGREEDITDFQNEEQDFVDIIRDKGDVRNAKITYNNVTMPPISPIATDKLQLNKIFNNYNVSKFVDIDNCFRDNFYNFVDLNKPDSYALIPAPASAICSPRKKFIPFDKNFKISKKIDKNHFSIRDIIFYKNKEIKMTNSTVFYLNHFYKKEAYYRFNTKLTEERPITVKITFI